MTKLAHNLEPQQVATIGDLMDASDALEQSQVKKTYGADPGPSAPKYIKACHTQSWMLATWSKTSEAPSVSTRPARCCSWRHTGPCAQQKAAEDYSRIQAALAPLPREDICYLVLTLDPSAWDGTGWRGWAGETPDRVPNAVKNESAISAAYSALSDRWRVLACAIRRDFGAFEYVSTVESHRNGWPHLNVILVSPEIARDAVVAHGGLYGWSQAAAGREAARIVLGGYLERAGFGAIAFLEPAGRITADGKDPLAAYVAKLAADNGTPWDGQSHGLLSTDGEVTSLDAQIVAEIAKLSQVPHRAPKNFRRLRSSKGFLPPIRRNPDITGILLDGNGQRVGKEPADRLLAAAAMSTEDERQCILAQIGDEFAKVDMRERDEWGEGGEIAVKATRRKLRKLIVAARICLGGPEDEWAMQVAADEATAERVAVRWLYWMRRNPGEARQIGLRLAEELDDFDWS